MTRVASSLMSAVLDPETKEHLEALEHLKTRTREDVHYDDDGGDADKASFSTKKVACSNFSVESVAPAPTVVGERVLMTSDVFADVEMFNCHGSNEKEKDGISKTVFSSIDRTDTRGGSFFLRTLVSQPVSDVAVLERRSRAVSEARTRLALPAAKQPLALRCPEEGRKIRRYEEDVMWLYRDRDEATASLYDIAFFRTWFTRSLNGCPSALSALNIYRIAISPLIGLLSPVLYFIVPYLIMRYKAADLRRVASELGVSIDLPTSFADYMRYVYDSYVAAGPAMEMMPSSLKWVKYASLGLSMMFYFQGLFNSYEISRTLRTVSRVLNEKMTHVCRFFARAASVINAYWSDDLRRAFYEDVLPPEDLEDVMNGLHSEDESEHLDFGGSLFSVGQGLSRYRVFDHERMLKLLRTYYAVDAVLSAARLTLADADDGMFSLVRHERRPALFLRRLWHPCIPRQKVIRNDVFVDRDAVSGDGLPNMMITGPNAGGKSTLIKSVVIAAILAQSIVAAPCAPGSACAPFRFVNSQINVPDVKGKRSLFEEEMFRARSNLDVVRDLARRNDDKNNCALVVIDEIFSSTNPVEGVSGAYAVAKHLALHRNCVTVISTHYPFLCRLGVASKDRPSDRLYANYQMPVKEDGSSKDGFVYPYELRRGLCRQYIALELLKKHGFDEDVIDEALLVKRELTNAAAREEKTQQNEKQTSPSPRYSAYRLQNTARLPSLVQQVAS